MKKMLTTLSIMIAFIVGMQVCHAISYSDAYQQIPSKPMLLLVYAPWSSGQNVIQQNFIALQKAYPGKLNFVLMDISKPEAKAFSEQYVINSKLPYVMMFRTSAKTARFIDRDCATNSSCFMSKVKTFFF